MRNDFVNEVRSRADGHWAKIFPQLNIPVNRREGPCPACGGKTRYRFDDKEGRGTYLCSHCGAGTGLDLVMKVKRCDVREAAKLVAEVLALPETAPARKEVSEQEAPESERPPVAGRVAALAAKAVPGQSAYLTAKGLQCPFPRLPDGTLLAVLTNGADKITGAQLIKSDGSKRLMAGSVKKGSFCVVNKVTGQPETVVIAEGLATTLTVKLMCPDAMVIAAMDASNLLPVSETFREKYPEARIIIAADNDIKPDEPNTGKEAAEKAAVAISGRVSLPPSEGKADWNDFYLSHGLVAATQAFKNSVYQPEGSRVTVKLTATDGGKKQTADPQSGRDNMAPFVVSGEDGVYWTEPQLDKLTGEINHKKTWLCDPVEITGEGVDTENGDTFISMRWKRHSDGEKVTKIIRPGLIGDPQGWAFLKNNGLNVATFGTSRARLADWILKQAKNGKHFTATPRSGWTGVFM